MYATASVLFSGFDLHLFERLSATSISPASSPSPSSQASNPELPVYEVSTIRPSPATAGDRHAWTRLNTLDVKHLPLKALLIGAFDAPEDMIA